MNQKAVSVLGLGDMGTALAGALLSAGHRVTVWNRTAAKAEPLVAEGASRADTAADAIVASPLVVVCLLGYDSVGEVLAPHTDVLAGRTLVNLTNGTPRQAREMAAWAADHGADYLDGGIMAVPPTVGTPAAFVLYSGPSGAFDASRSVLDAFGESHYLGEDPGLAPLHDIALLNSMYGMFGGVLHACALVRSAGGSAAEFAPMARKYVETMGAYAEAMAVRIDAGDYADDVTSNLAMQSSAYVNFLDTAEEAGISTELITPIYSLLQRRVADGHGHEDTASIVELLKK